MPRERLLIPESARDALDYCPITGLFRWKSVFGNRKPGWFAGCRLPRGHRSISFQRRRYYAHRLAWFFSYGDEPDEIDHINGDASDNRIGNRRVAAHGQNIANAPRRKASGHKGAYFIKRTGRWSATIKVDYRACYLGTFATEIEAAQAYDAAAKRLFGEFAHVNFPEAA